MSSYTPKHGSNGCTGYVLAFLAVIAAIAAALFIAACAGAAVPARTLSSPAHSMHQQAADVGAIGNGLHGVTR